APFLELPEEKERSPSLSSVFYEHCRAATRQLRLARRSADPTEKTVAGSRFFQSAARGGAREAFSGRARIARRCRCSSVVSGRSAPLLSSRAPASNSAHARIAFQWPFSGLLLPRQNCAVRS